VVSSAERWWGVILGDLMAGGAIAVAGRHEGIQILTDSGSGRALADRARF